MVGSAMIHQAIFITGTDTGVGKTTVTAALLLALQHQGHSVGVLKPIETGVDGECLDHSDTERLRQLLSPPPSFDSVCLYAFPQPLAPLSAARKTGTAIDPSHIHSQVAKLGQRYSCLLIEGAGGIFTPVAPHYTMRDFITLSNIPCLIVGHTNLGGVNHCMLTLHALQHVGINVLGIVLNEHHSQNSTAIIQEQQESTVELIREEASIPVFGPLGFTQTLETHWLEGVRKISGDSEIQRLARYLTRREQETS